VFKRSLLSSFKNLIRGLRKAGSALPPNIEGAEIRALVRSFFRAERERLSKGAHSLGKCTAPEILNRRRYARSVTQRIKRWARVGGKRPQFSKQQLIAQFRVDPILDSLLARREARWTPPLKRDYDGGHIDISLERFSFLDNPGQTLANLKRIAEVECEKIEARLHFRDEYCLDIGAYLVLGEIWPRLSPFLSGGEMNPPVQKVMEAVGLRKLMRMRLAVADLKDVWAFPVRRRAPLGQSRSDADRLLEPQRDQMVADEFCDAIDGWLGISTKHVELTDDGRVWIQQIILELLDNAKRHSDPAHKDGRWSIAGFMARRRNDKGAFEFRCYIGILSVGATIDESLATCSEATAAQMKTYVDRHKGAGFSEAALRTVFALQDGITRDAEADAGGRGGVGFQEVMSLINLLGISDNPMRDTQFTIVSGTTCIVARKPYMHGRQMTGQDSPRVLWFNPENTPEKPPDRSHVFDLQDRLAGSIISLAFTLDPDFINKVVPDNGRN
jgi:two-component sensor histidine kinase